MWPIILAAGALAAASAGGSGPKTRTTSGPVRLRRGQIYRIGGHLVGLEHDAEMLGVHVSVAALAFASGLRTAGAWDVAIQPALPLPFAFSIVYPMDMALTLPGRPQLEPWLEGPASAYPVYEWVERTTRSKP